MVFKLIDGDGDIETDDWTFGSGWNFSAAVTDGAVDPASDTTSADGFVVFAVTPEANETPTRVDISETAKNGYRFLDAQCVRDDSIDSESRIRALRASIGAKVEGVLLGTVGDGEVSDIPIAEGDVVLCIFVNTPSGPGASPSGAVQAATGAPRITPPPTSTSGSPGAPGTTLALVLLVLAAANLGLVVIGTRARRARR